MSEIKIDPPIPVRIRSGVNHGLYGHAVAYREREFRVDFGYLGNQLAAPNKKKWYALYRLETATPESMCKLVWMIPESPRRDRILARMVAQKLAEKPTQPVQIGGAYGAAGFYKHYLFRSGGE